MNRPYAKKIHFISYQPFASVASPRPSSLRLATLLIPHLRAFGRQFQNFGRTRPFRVVTARLGQSLKLRRLFGVIRKEHFGFALSRPPDRGRESTHLCSICPLFERPGTRVETHPSDGFISSAFLFGRPGVASSLGGFE
jgi:hypothetical protein